LDLLTDPFHTANVIDGGSLTRLTVLPVLGAAASEIGRFIPPFG
jgi:hypothetical protein